jgi:hypothetical protein
MPMSKTGKSVMSEFVKRYGKEKGKQVFYGRVNTGGPKFAQAVGETSVRKRAGKSTGK